MNSSSELSKKLNMPNMNANGTGARSTNVKAAGNGCMTNARTQNSVPIDNGAATEPITLANVAGFLRVG